MDKKNLRKKIINKRDLLSAELRENKAKTIISKILTSELYVNADHIMLFSAFGSELDLNSLLEEIWQAKKHAYLPVVDPDSNKILPVEVFSFSELKRSNYGILEPSPANYNAATPNLLELILTPAVAFDTDKYRIGYGAGYYDRFFSSLAQPVIKIGVGFDEQLVDAVPKEPHDVQLDYVLTDKRWLK